MADLNDPLKDSYIGKVADALKPYSADLTAQTAGPVRESLIGSQNGRHA